MKQPRFFENSPLPLVFEADPQHAQHPTADDLCAWITANRPLYEQQLHQVGALLFRGFSIDTPQAFQTFLGTVDSTLLAYVGGNSPRTKLQSGIYTSTEYPAEFFISLHNENSYGPQWPERLYFCCVTAPQSGGSTVIADCRRVLQDLDPEIAETFANKQVRYLRRLHAGKGMGPSWQDTFETDDAEAVEELCRQGGIHYRWERHKTLLLSQVAPGVLTHPVTGERVWFNQADQFHPSSQGPTVYASMKTLYGDHPEKFPTYATFGDGSFIPESWFQHITDVFARHNRRFPLAHR